LPGWAGAAPAKRDTRTAALLQPAPLPSLKTRRGDALRQAASDNGIRHIDDMAPAARARVTFKQRGAGLPRFGYNVPNAASSRTCEAGGAHRSFLGDADRCGVTQVKVGAAGRRNCLARRWGTCSAAD